MAICPMRITSASKAVWRGDPQLPNDFFDLRSGLSLAQSKGDLLLGKLRFLHVELSSS